MSGAITAAGVVTAGTLIASNQAKQAAKGAANAQKDAANAATQVERERLQQEAQQYQQQMQEYQRRQAINERQMQQTITNLAPYMQAGQGALYEMMALTGLAAPAGAIPGAPIGGAAGTAAPTGTANVPMRQAFGTGGGGISLSNLAGTVAPTSFGELQTYENSPAAKEFQMGGLSLGSSKWANVDPTKSNRALAAQTLQTVQREMPNATAQEQRDEAIRRLNTDYKAQQQQSMMQQAAATVPTVETAANPYAGMTGREAQQTAIQKVAQSPLLQELMAQGETGILQNAAATGGLRGGRTQGVLAQYRPQMLQNEIDKLYSRLSGISGMGQQSILSAPTSGTMTLPSMSYQSQIPGLLTEAGAAQAGGILSGANNQQQLWNQLGQTVGWGLEKYAQNQAGTTTPTTAPNYAGFGIGNPSNY